MSTTGARGGRDVWGPLRNRKEEILSVREEVVKRRRPLGRAVDRVGGLLASAPFLVTLVAVHAAWVVVNIPFVPWQPWDPYPFTFLATVASVEAPIITVLVLMRQQQDRHVAEIREEVQLQVSLLVEKEATMALRLLDRLREERGIDVEVEGLDRLEGELSPERMMKDLEKRLENNPGDREED